MLPFENIPDDLVPLTAHFKQLLTYANENQPLTLYLDSVDQLTGTQDSNSVSWIPTRLPVHCKVNHFFLYVLRAYIDNCNGALLLL